MVIFKQLWAVAEQEAQRTNGEPKYVFADIGLFLEEEPENEDYDLTPLNSKAFAHTGGDGVHYSFLISDDKELDQSPIVMTVPCAWEEKANVIVGETLHEFLCLGCYFGYFSLEQLVYDPEKTLLLLQNPQVASESEENLLALLRNELSLTPWGNVEARLKELNSKFLSSLKMGSSS